MDTGLDFLAREALAAMGAERVVAVERDLRAARELEATVPGLRVEHAPRAEPAPGDLVILPVAKQRLALFLELERLAALIGPEGLIALYGERREGILPAQALLAEHCDLQPPITRGGGRLLLARPRAASWGLEQPPRHYLATVRGQEIKVAAQPGLFSWNDLDPATALLLDSCSPRNGDRLLDLGCGAGVLGTALLLEGLVSAATLCDSDALALEASRRTLALNGLNAEIVSVGNIAEDAPGAVIVASDSGSELPGRRYDLVLANPPLHASFAADRDTLPRMVAEAERLLATKGRACFVGPPTLGLGRLLEAAFGGAERVAEESSFQVWRAVKRRSRRPDARSPG